MDPQFDGVIYQTHPEELHRRMKFDYPPYAVIDVRPAKAWKEGSVPGALHVVLEDLESSLPEGTDERTELIVFGEDHEDPVRRAVTLRLRELGAQRVVEMPGGFREWNLRGFATEPPR